MKEWFKARNVWGAALSALSDEQAGRLAKAVWAYTMDGVIEELEGAEKGIFAMILITLQQDEEHDQYVSAVRSNATISRRKSNDSSKDQMQSNDIKCNQMISNDIKCDNKNKNKKENKNKEKEQEKELMFERFWEAYPRHVNKQSAFKAFMKINPDENMLEIIIKEIEKQKKSLQWTKDNGQFIPHPATWLNGKRWEDELPTGYCSNTVVGQQFTQRDYSGEDEEAIRRMLELEGERA